MQSLIEYLNEEDTKKTSELLQDFRKMFSGDQKATDVDDAHADAYYKFLTNYLRPNRLDSYLTLAKRFSSNPSGDEHESEAAAVVYLANHVAAVLASKNSKLSEQNRTKFEAFRDSLDKTTSTFEGNKKFQTSVRANLIPVIQNTQATGSKKDEEEFKAKDDKFHADRIASAKNSSKQERITGLSPAESAQIKKIRDGAKDENGIARPLTDAEDRRIKYIELQKNRRDEKPNTTVVGDLLRGKSGKDNAVSNFIDKKAADVRNSNTADNLNVMKNRIKQSTIGRTIRGISHKAEMKGNSSTIDKSVNSIINTIDTNTDPMNVKNALISGLSILEKNIIDYKKNIVDNNKGRNKFDKGLMKDDSANLRIEAIQKIEDALTNSPNEAIAKDKEALMNILHKAETQVKSGKQTGFEKEKLPAEIESEAKAAEGEALNKDNAINSKVSQIKDKTLSLPAPDKSASGPVINAGANKPEEAGQNLSIAPEKIEPKKEEPIMEPTKDNTETEKVVDKVKAKIAEPVAEKPDENTKAPKFVKPESAPEPEPAPEADKTEKPETIESIKPQIVDLSNRIKAETNREAKIALMGQRRELELKRDQLAAAKRAEADRQASAIVESIKEIANKAKQRV